MLSNVEKKILYFLSPRFREIEAEHKEAQKNMIQHAMRLDRKASDVRQTLAQQTLIPIAKG